MNLLTRITDWRSRARVANFQCRELARICDVSPGYLNQFFVLHFYRPPQDWLDELRLWQAFRMLCEGTSIKECLHTLKYKQVSHFSRVFTRYHGLCPSRCADIYQSRERAQLRELVSKLPAGCDPLVMLPVPPWIQAEFALSLRPEERTELFIQIASQTGIRVGSSNANLCKR